MRIGVFVESQPGTGGGFEQSLTGTEGLVRSPTLRHEVVVFTPHETTRQRLAQSGISAVVYSDSVLRLADIWSGTAVGGALMRALRQLGWRRAGRFLDAMLADHGVDVAVFNECATGVRRVGDHPFLMTLWDVDHRDHPELPEWYRGRNFENRERALEPLRRAVGVIVSSAHVGRRVAALYGIDPHRIVHVPLRPSSSVRQQASAPVPAVDVRARYALARPYVLCPVYFLPQKNHLYVFEAVAQLERQHDVRIDVVCTGGEGWMPNRAVVARQARALGLGDRVRLLGLVPANELAALYRSALALVMPSVAGPANLPPVEANLLGCPVICADLPGCRDQMGDAARYCDLALPASLADHLAELHRDSAAADELRTRGRERAERLARVDDGTLLAPLFDAHDEIRRRWAKV